MTRKSVWRGVLIAVLTVALATQGLADHPRLGAPTNFGPSKGAVNAVVIGIAAAAAVAILVVVLLVRHKPQDSAITGCVSSGANGTSLKDEKDHRSYTLSGSTAGVTAGNRMRLEGKRTHTGKTLVFEAHRVAKDYGVCQP